jgi:putative phage-type endonuclease
MTTLLTPPTLPLPADPEALALPPPDEHDRWLEMRRTGLGGSDAAAALGLNRYSSPYKLFCEKLGLVPDFVGNERTRWGKRLEDVVATEAARRLGADTVLAPTAMYRSKSWPWMLANPDRFLIFSDGSVAILEVKTTDWRLADQWDEREGEAPVHHVLQLMHYLAVTGLDRGHLVCLVGGNDLRMVEVHRDDLLIAEMADGEKALWDRICSGDAPPAAGHPGQAGVVIEMPGADVVGGDHRPSLLPPFPIGPKRSGRDV